ncbi:MAG: YbhB/YbcL family Raf kinase inhibitor-like protein [Altererythrobacter sp.]|nr:YbhB/YbcL family Raf kinase inhibitor-like protein [Altererythrobacter sp.]OJU59983.1 MAG: YbhB and YbcL [Altererythrobacter sp. 66-12]
MLEHVPDWLGKALRNVRSGHAKLALARLGTEALLNRDGFAIRSAAFNDGEELDPCFTADEDDAVAPPLDWTAPPAGTAELALIVEDPDAPTPQPFCHWLVWGLAPQRGQLLEGEVPPRVGKNSFGNSEWLPPDPPTGHGPHDYVFQLFALDISLDLMPGAGRGDLIEAMEGHVLAAATLTGTYARGGDEDDLDWEDDDGM